MIYMAPTTPDLGVFSSTALMEHRQLIVIA